MTTATTDEKAERDPIPGIVDIERVERQQPEEVEGQHGQCAEHQSRDQPEPRRGDQHQGEVGESGLGRPDIGAECVAQGGGDHEQSDADDIGHGIEGARRDRRRHRLRRCRRAAGAFFGDHMHANFSRLPGECAGDRAAQPVEPARRLEVSDDDLRDVVLPRISQDILGNPAAGQRQRIAAELFGEAQAIGDAVALILVEMAVPGGLDVDRGQLCVEPVGELSGMVHQAGAGRVAADANQDMLWDRRRWRFHRRPGGRLIVSHHRPEVRRHVESLVSTCRDP